MMKFEVLIIGSDINAYFMARNFHEEYGIKCHIIAKFLMAFTARSNICDIEYEPALWEPQVFLSKLLEYGKKRREVIGDVPIILVGTNDTYVRLIIENAETLKQYYTFNYVDLPLFNSLSLKDKFYTKYQGHNIEFPKTYIFDCKENIENIEKDKINSFKFPVIVKAGNGVEYFKHEFEGQAKVYKLQTIEEIIETIKKITEAGYTDNLIIQEYIPGDETYLFDAVLYSNTKGKVEFMTFAQIGLQERTITGVGNCTVLINGYNQYGKYQNIVKNLKEFAEKIGYKGPGEFDLKYDSRDGKYKVLEINPRQGRSSYYSTAVGCNIAKYLVDDLIYKKHKKFKMADKQVALSFVPMSVINTYIDNKEYVKKFKKLKREKCLIDPLKYSKDMSFKRCIWLFKRALNYNRKYKNNKW